MFEVDRYRLVRCIQCELVFVANPPSEAELRHLYSFASGFHSDFQTKPKLLDLHLKVARRRATQLNRLAAPGRLLDVGAAAGYFVKAAVDAGWDAQGVDLSPDTSRLARERYGVEVLCGRLEDLQAAPQSFDALTMWDLLEHVESPVEELEKAQRLLRPGGVLALSTPNLDGWYPRLSYRVADRIGRWPAVEPPKHLSQFTVKTLGSLLAQTGLQIVAVKHKAQSLRYSFRQVLDLGPPRFLAYAAVFMPVAAIGPLFHRGDEIEVFARLPS